jgi:hypothetical protein
MERDGEAEGWGGGERGAGEGGGVGGMTVRDAVCDEMCALDMRAGANCTSHDSMTLHVHTGEQGVEAASAGATQCSPGKSGPRGFGGGSEGAEGGRSGGGGWGKRTRVPQEGLSRQQVEQQHFVDTAQVSLELLSHLPGVLCGAYTCGPGRLKDTHARTHARAHTHMIQY